MFQNATVFNQDLSTWNVSKVTSADNIFCNSPLSLPENASKRPPITPPPNWGC
jgi:surface protein